MKSDHLVGYLALSQMGVRGGWSVWENLIGSIGSNIEQDDYRSIENFSPIPTQECGGKALPVDRVLHGADHHVGIHTAITLKPSL